MLSVNGHAVRAARFRAHLQAVPVGILQERPVIVLRNERGHGLAEIVEKPLAGFGAAKNAPREDGQPRSHVVAATPLEFRREAGGPVERLDFPTVGVQVFQRAIADVLCVGHERLHHGIPVALECPGIHRIERQSIPSLAARRNARAGTDRVTETVDAPRAGRRGPLEPAIHVGEPRQINHVRGRHRRAVARRRLGRNQKRRVVIGARHGPIERLLLPARDAVRRRRRPPPARTFDAYFRHLNIARPAGNGRGIVAVGHPDFQLPDGLHRLDVGAPGAVFPSAPRRQFAPGAVRSDCKDLKRFRPISRPA